MQTYLLLDRDWETCIYDPPIPYPDDGNKYIWNETDENWKQVE